MPSSGTPEPAEVFARLIGRLDAPMVIVTAASGGERSGCLVGFATQVSIRPPRFLACISAANHTHGVALRAAALGVHVLDEDDRHLAEVFGALTGDAVDKLSLVRWCDGPEGVPLLADAAGWFVGRVLQRIDLGDHTGHVVDVVAAGERHWSRPLGYQSAKDIDPGHAP
jgi:flavin reductase (DIM6/NTAB) family NADH-FMN oxidoreductase RutF